MADPHFGVESEAEQWSAYEVAGWVQRSGYGYATKRFFDAQIDGNVLLHDVTHSQLLNQLGINAVHSNKFLRDLDAMKLRVLTPSAGPLVVDWVVSTVDIPAEQSRHEEQVAALQKEHGVQVQALQRVVDEARSRVNALQSQSAESTLALHRDLNRAEEKFLKSQQEIVALKSTINDVKEAMGALKQRHLETLSELKQQHHREVAAAREQLMDYESMKSDYDSIIGQLNRSKQALSALKVEYAALEQTQRLQVEGMERQFKRETDALEAQIGSLQQARDGLSDQNRQLKLAAAASPPPPAPAAAAALRGPMTVIESNEFDHNPYLCSDFSSPKRAQSAVPCTLNSVSLKPLGFGLSSHHNSSSLAQYMQSLEQKAQDEDQRFAVHV